MSYRVTVFNSDGERLQIFPNNYYPEEFLDWLKENKIIKNTNKEIFGNFKKSEFKDIQGLIDLIEDDTLKYLKKKQNNEIEFSTLLIECGALKIHEYAQGLLEFENIFASYCLVNLLTISNDIHFNFKTRRYEVVEGKSIYIDIL